MININLNPGAKKEARSKGIPKLSMGNPLAGFGASFKDPFLFIALGGLVIGVLATGSLYLSLSSRESDLAEREQQAVQDSTRFAAVLKERKAAEARRDSVDRQLVVIKAIDGERFIWPHLLDEVAEALPAYTWLTTVTQTSQTASIAVRDSLLTPRAPNDTSPPRPADAPRPDLLTFRVIGQTVDIQALTRYMRVLEASPFIEQVVLVRSDLTTIDNRDVTVFTLDMRYEIPDPSMLEMIPLQPRGR